MTNLFLRMILNMRKEEIMLYDNLLKISDSEAQEVVYFLDVEYQGEAEDFPFQASTFDANAALWAARTIYYASQLILFRESQPDELESILPSYEGTIDPSAILSVDLSLRFVPNIMKHLKLIDPEDSLIKILEKHLATWHYSAVGYDLKDSTLDFEVINNSPCLKQLYLDRVIEKKAQNLAKIPIINQGIKATLGMYSTVFWKEFELI